MPLRFLRFNPDLHRSTWAGVEACHPPLSFLNGFIQTTVSARAPATNLSLQRATPWLRRRKVRTRITEAKRNLPNVYLSASINRADGPEDRSLAERCLSGALPDFGSANGGFSRIVQARGEVSIFYD